MCERVWQCLWSVTAYRSTTRGWWIMWFVPNLYIIGVPTRVCLLCKLDTNSLMSHILFLHVAHLHEQIPERVKKKNDMKFHQVHAFSLHTFASLDRLIIRINFPTTNDTAVKQNLFFNSFSYKFPMFISLFNICSDFSSVWHFFLLFWFHFFFYLKCSKLIKPCFKRSRSLSKSLNFFF